VKSKLTTTGSGLVRATVWTEHGASSKTFATASEARSWCAVAANRKPAKGEKDDD